MADQKTAALVDYEVAVAREIGGVHRMVGDLLSMPPAQAKYYLPPYGTGLKAVAPKGLGKPKVDAEKPLPIGDGAKG